MKNAMRKDFWREIQHTRSRFFSIMILVALSVAFLSGLKATAPDMKRTGDDYLDSLHLADIQVLSTLGLTDDDIQSLPQRPANRAYTDYMIEATKNGEGEAECIAAVLPCMLSYFWIFRRLLKRSPGVLDTVFGG